MDLAWRENNGPMSTDSHETAAPFPTGTVAWLRQGIVITCSGLLETRLKEEEMALLSAVNIS